MFRILHTQFCILRSCTLCLLPIWPFSGLCDAAASSVCDLWTLYMDFIIITEFSVESQNSNANKWGYYHHQRIIIGRGGQITKFKWKSHPIKQSCSMHFSRSRIINIITTMVSTLANISFFIHWIVCWQKQDHQSCDAKILKKRQLPTLMMVWFLELPSL